MLYQELPRIDSTPLDKWGRWLVPGLIAAVGVTVAVILLVVGQSSFAALAFFAGLGAGGIVYLRSPAESP
ncbi:MAG: hypothetical protein HOP91_04875, partial [Sphingomonas sp.]|nr:hypothetical protein [Sphingomonas sp.]